MSQGGAEHHTKNMKCFVLLLVIVQIAIIVLYGVFVRIEHLPTASTVNVERYPAYQDVNVMMLIGFGYLMAFSRSFSWSAVSYTFLMNAVCVQLYILLSAFWKRVISTGFHEQHIHVSEPEFTAALYSAASLFICMGCVIGRIGPLQILIMGIVHEVGYTLNQVIVMEKIKAFDVGGSMVIHAFGAYQGLAISLIMGSMTKPASKPALNYFSNLFAFIGALFLWMYWPSFNFGFFSTTAFTKTQIITNTILSLTGSCIATFATSAFLKNKFTLEHLLNATLAGGVVIGATAGIIFHVGGSIAIGFLCGIVSTLGYHYLTPYLEKKINLYDTCGVHNLHAMPGLLGGIISAIVAASFQNPSATDGYTMTSADFPEYDALISTPFKQGGLQIAGTFISIGIGISTALISGIFMKFVYSFNQKEFYTDAIYFEEAEQFIAELNHEVTETDNHKTQAAKIVGAELVINTISKQDSHSHINV